MHTKNLGEAAYLYALGMPFTMEVSEDGRATIIFESNNAKEAAMDYYAGSKIEAVKLIESYKTIKTKVYEHLNKRRIKQ